VFHTTGTKRLLGGAPQPIDENVTTAVTVNDSSDSPAVRLLSTSSTYTRDDTRRFSPSGVELLATTFSASGASFGGTLQPPQLLARWPFITGDSWSGTSTAGSITITGTGRVTGERDVATPAGTFHCYDVTLDATITGAVQGEQHETACWVPSLGMPVDSTQTITGTYSGFPFELTIHSVLRSAP
jgi:hypothetical protein